MTTSFIADLEEIVYPSSLDAEDDTALPRVDAWRVLHGMFVAELDRPWSDTPLPQGGLLVSEDDELEAIRRHCRQVRIDPARSAPDVLDAIKAAALLSNEHVLTLVDEPSTAHPAAGGAGPSSSASAGAATRRRRGNRRIESAQSVSLLPEPAEPRDDVHPSDEARVRLRALLLASEGKPVSPERSGAVARLRTWLSAGARAASASPRLCDLDELRARYGETIGAVEPVDPTPIRQSFAEARVAHARLVGAANALVAQVRQGGTPKLEALGEPIDGFVATLQHAPDALRWAEAVYAQNVPLPNAASAVALNLACFGRSLGMPVQALRELVLVGLLLDLGKALLPRELLEHPGVLAPHDYALVQQHVTIGLDLLERAGSLEPAVLRAIAEHHERLDGSGYPRRLRGDDIGLLGRMTAIVDTFSGLTAVRAYANPLSVEDALSALNEWGASLFCRDLVERFVLSIGVFPVGTLVELRGGEVAAVVDRPHGERAAPKLVVLTSADKGPLRMVRDRTGRQEPDEIYSGAHVRIARGLATGAFGLRLPDYYGRAPVHSI